MDIIWIFTENNMMLRVTCELLPARPGRVLPGEVFPQPEVHRPGLAPEPRPRLPPAAAAALGHGQPRHLRFCWLLLSLLLLLRMWVSAYLWAVVPSLVQLGGITLAQCLLLLMLTIHFVIFIVKSNVTETKRWKTFHFRQTFTFFLVPTLERNFRWI